MKLLIAALLPLLLAGCAPRTYEDCKAEAAKSPTERGVQVAAQACYEKFEKPRLATELEIAKGRAALIEKSWPSVMKAPTLDAVHVAIGKPDESAPAPCAKTPHAQTPARCIEHTWKDVRYPGACPTSPALLAMGVQPKQDEYCRWRLQSLPDGTVWAAWPDPT